jgi:hypothetical protein
VVAVLVLVLRKPLRDLLPLLQHLKYRDLELDFGSSVEEVKEELEEELPAGAIPQFSVAELGSMQRLAEISPRSAVLEAWREVERAALEASQPPAGRLYPYKSLTFQAFKNLERNEALDKKVLGVLRDLRGLRNQAAHAPDFALTKESALEYAASAKRLARYLKGLHGPN